MGKLSTAFTLIELLVVVTIIVVLLALLVPAMDKAIYQAELLLCGTQMRNTAQGATIYAFDNAKRYMYRRASEVNTFSYLLKGAAAFIAVDAGVEDRPIHEGYIDLDWLMDPLAHAVDPKIKPLENPNESIYANVMMWYGWQYIGRKGMKRLGDRWVGRDPRFEGRDYAMAWLVTDMDICNRGFAAFSGHPDKDGILNNAFAQAGEFDYGDDNPEMQIGFNATLPITYSFWRRPAGSGHNHGRMDLNFASDDGSVIRLVDVENEFDERIAHLPTQHHTGSGNVWNNVAKP